VGLLVAALVLVALALYLSHLRGRDGEGGKSFKVSGTYQGVLLGRHVSPYSLQAITLTEQFRSAVGGRVEVRSDSPASGRISITAFASQEKELKPALERAVQLLSVQARELALAEVEGALSLVREAQESAGRWSVPLGEPSAAADRTVSEDDTTKMLLLGTEIEQLETFLRGGKMAATLRSKLSRDSLDKARERVRDAELEMGRLAQLFNSSNNVLRAQQEYVKKARAELRALEQELARARLQALRAELAKLEQKATALIEENKNRPLVAAPSGLDEPEGPSEDLLSERARELALRAEEISGSDDLELVGSLEFGRVSDPFYAAQLACWLGALGLFWVALFYTPRRRAGREAASWTARRATFKPQADHYELFFSRLYSDMEYTLGASPKRILVLGDSHTETRLAFSIRFAESLSKEHPQVRLVDFDLEGKHLSERLGREKLPGVGNVLVEGGPVDEFFSSIAGTTVQFAPAGSLTSLSPEAVGSERVGRLLGPSEAVVVVDAGGSAPFELLTPHLDSVLFALGPGQGMPALEGPELEALRGFQEAGLPIWEVHVNEGAFHPLS